MAFDVWVSTFGFGLGYVYSVEDFLCFLLVVFNIHLSLQLMPCHISSDLNGFRPLRPEIRLGPGADVQTLF